MIELLQDLGSWAWDRHHNILSWWIRPLFLLPFGYFAYQRSWKGIVVTLVALATSMAWFPAPDHPSAEVISMLDAERNYLLNDWTVGKVAVSLLVPLVFAAVAVALWRRSAIWALVVINAALAFKIGWTFVVSDFDGAMAHLTPALVGLAVVNALYFTAAAILKRRRPAADEPVVELSELSAR
jgi:hypothetical protein